MSDETTVIRIGNDPIKLRVLGRDTAPWHIGAVCPKCGVEAGTPDLCVLRPGGRVVWVELKAPRGVLTTTQRAWHDRALVLGHKVHVCRTVAEVLEAMRD